MITRIRFKCRLAVQSRAAMAADAERKLKEGFKGAESARQSVAGGGEGGESEEMKAEVSKGSGEREPLQIRTKKQIEREKKEAERRAKHQVKRCGVNGTLKACFVGHCSDLLDR